MEETQKKTQAGTSRREFFRESTLISVAVNLFAGRSEAAPAAGRTPWYRRTFRWGQTNLSEEDPSRCDVSWWRDYWRKTRVEGVIINAGGIVAYYPSRFPLHHRAEKLGDRDLYGELARAAREDGLVVLARMDSNRTYEPFFRAHPEWFAVDRDGEPYRAGELYITCINSPYYDDYLPGVFREIIERSHPEGFADNSWSGLDRETICFCRYCDGRFRQATGRNLPRRKDWDDSDYREWINWNYNRRLQIWESNNQVARGAGGPDCLWIGMIGDRPSSEAKRFHDLKAICERAEFILLDQQSRNPGGGFEDNAEVGKRLHGVLGWDKPIAESMAMYQRNPTFRKAANPESEARLWMAGGFAGGIQPWWHHVGAFQEDRRQFRVPPSMCRWYAENQEYLVGLDPVAVVGVVWSQRGNDFYGRDDAELLSDAPYRGVIRALVRGRVPYVPVHLDSLARLPETVAVLILPNVASMSEEQAAAIRAFAARGGGLLITAETSLYDTSGGRRPDFLLADLMGANWAGDGWGPGALGSTDHSYLRLEPASGPSSTRHAVLAGFEDTDIVPFGGRLLDVRARPGTVTPASYVPDFPIYPPETSWMRQAKTSSPALILNDGNARVAYLPADLDRRFGLAALPDHGLMLRNLFTWVARDRSPLRVEGKGLIDCHLYRQKNRLVLQFVNLTSAGYWRGPVEEVWPIGPFQVIVRVPGFNVKRARCLVSGKKLSVSGTPVDQRFTLDRLLEHEVVVME